ncbi:HTH-type transcriptional regulator GalR [Enterobacter sp. Bisph1]|uniref:HTH-type transcriptional regulator GalR n=1 Tax=Enterobacter sp. Bisph1 TaxID=1274399 RepID=UPI00057BF17E|nr:HTH-type transcriptional regulator GalR [Enterobacter sp. Bisph1]
MATIKDVARLAGVSVATVSRVINASPKASESSRQAVQSAMDALNYHPNANARALAQQSSETMGLVVGDVSDPFFGAMVKAVEQVASASGNFLLIGNGYHTEEKERKAIEQLIRHRCAALVVHAKVIPDEELASLMQQIPGMVLINRILPGYEQRCVALDDRYGAWLATRHLVQQGHTRIGYLCSNHAISDAEDRLQGYYDALKESGLPCNDRLVTFAEPDESGGEQAMTELLGRGRNFSAVACYNDSMAAGAMGVLNDNGIDVPGEISLIGFDDVLVSRYVRPRLTTVRYPIITMAAQAAELALALAENRPLPEITNLFNPTLVRRHSVISPQE